jgi:hypothetical protein
MQCQYLFPAYPTAKLIILVRMRFFALTGRPGDAIKDPLFPRQ